MNFLYWLLCVLIGLIPAFLVFRKDRKRNVPVKWLPAVLRFFSFFLTAALLLAPAFPVHKTIAEKPVVVWLQDNSLSMKHALKKDTAIYREKTEALWKQWGKHYKVVPVAFGTTLLRNGFFNYNQKSTDIAGALKNISEQYRDRNLGAVIVVSDGNFNQGLNPLYATIPHNCTVYTIGLGDSTVPKDALVSRIYANKTVALNSTFEIMADLQALKLSGFKTEATLQQDGKIIARSPVSISSDYFTTTVRFKVKATKAGFQRYTVALSPVGKEENIQNNRRDIFVEVTEDKVNILILASAPHPDIAAIKAALAADERYKITIKYGKGIPQDVSSYNLVIAHQVPSKTGVRLPDVKDMPVWYILGDQSDLAAFNSEQHLLQLSNAGRSNDVLPLPDKGFNLFTLPENIHEVLAKMPPLKVPSGTYKPVGNAQVLLHQQIGNVVTDYPLWLFQTGTTPAAVLAGTGIWRWRIFEYKNFKNHEATDALIRQTVSLLRMHKDTRPFQVFMDKYVFNDNESLNIYAGLRNENRELVNTPEATLIIEDSSGKALSYVFEKEANRYKLNLGLLAPGVYSFRGKVRFNGKDYESKGAFRVESLPLEQLKTYSDYALLYQLAHQSGGHFFTLENMEALTDSLNLNANMKTVLHADTTYLQLIDRRWFFFLILLFIASEWFLRKYWGL